MLRLVFHNHFHLRSLSRSAMWTNGLYSVTTIYFYLPRNSILRIHSRLFICFLFNLQPLDYVHVPRSTGHLGSKQCVSLHPRVIPSRRWNRPYLSTVRSRNEYSIPLSFPLLTFAQLDAPESTTAVDVIDPYLSAIRLGDTYQIPLGSVILTIT